MLVAPSAVVICNCIESRFEEAEETEGEYHEATVASLLTLTECAPRLAPLAAVAVTAEDEEDTVRAVSGPERSPRLLRSVERVEIALWMEVSAVICDLTVVCWACHWRSGACAA